MKVRIKEETSNMKTVMEYAKYLAENYLIGVEYIVVKEDIVCMKNSISKALMNNKRNVTCNIDTTTLIIINSEKSRQVMNEYRESPYVLGFAVCSVLQKASDWAKKYLEVMAER